MGWANTRNILCVRLDAMGDVLMTTPALRAMKHQAPDRRLTLLTSRSGAAVADMVPEVDRAILYDAPWVKETGPLASSAGDREMIERLRRERFDGAVIFTVFSQSPLPAAMLCWLADIPLRAAHAHEHVYQLLSDWLPDPEAERVRHEVQRQLDLVGALGFHAPDAHLSLRVPPEAFAAIDGLLAELGLDGARPWAVIHCGASAPSRRYPRWDEVARQLMARGWQMLFTGSAAEAGLVDSIVAAGGGRSLAGRLTLPELAALIARAPVLLSGNTGPVHIAAAVGTPVVDLYALTNPQHTPWLVPARVLSHDVPCRDCCKSVCPEGHHNCLRLVEPTEVVQAAEELIRRPPQRRASSGAPPGTGWRAAG